MNELNHIPNNESFDPLENLLFALVDGKVFHGVYLSAQYAEDLLQDGSDVALSRAEDVLLAVLSCQELDQNNPHYGNFFWEKEEGIVEDLNAVEFVLIRLIPMMIRYNDRISESLQQKIMFAVLRGLEEIKRVDVALIYTNIVAKDIVNSILGGELLGESSYVDRGTKKLKAWQAFIDQNGIPHEYNSPSYAPVTIRALSNLVDLSKDDEIKMIAKLIMIRLGISFALHLHPTTKRLAGPHCRAYYQFLTFQTPPETQVFNDLIDQTQLPEWLAKLVSHRPQKMNVRETSDHRKKVGIGTYHSESFSLGVATREHDTQSNRYISNQSNVFSVQFSRGSDALPGIVYSRYLLNDKWLGDYRTTASRGNHDIFLDEGSFRGIQNRNRSINIYSPKDLGAWERCFSAKACLIWNSKIDGVWINGKYVENFPTEIHNTDVIVVASGEIFTAIRPLSITDLGNNSPIRIVEREESIVLELYNYLGPTKTFWELATPGAFYQGRVRCGFYAEIAEKSEYSSGADFSAVVANGTLSEKIDGPITYDGSNARYWSVEYQRGDETLGIELDMMEFEIENMWASDSSDMLPMLDSPIAIQAHSGDLKIHNSLLSCESEGVRWLVSMPDVKTWIAGYHGPKPTALNLKTPQGCVEIERLSRGLVIWENGKVQIESIGLIGNPRIVGGDFRGDL